jgi:serine/threonine protein kinase
MNKIGCYEIHKNKFLGEGSYAKVYEGIYTGTNRSDIHSGKRIAVKIVQTNKLGETSLKIIEREAQIMNVIKMDPHPNIVECYDVIRTDGYIYIFMEFCSAGDLRSIMGQPIKEDFVKFFMSQLVNGLKYLSDHNIIHRDIKPRNILLTQERRVLKIADFGFARQLIDEPDSTIKSTDKKKKDNSHLYETVCGSPMYMAPEILDKNKEKYDRKTDLWSIGMMMYEMLYGIHPYHECTDISELIKLNKDKNNIKIPPNNNTNITISNECLSLVRLLLQKDSTKRMSWDDFFSDQWLTTYQYIIPKTNKKNENYEEQICAVSIGSLAERINLDKNKCKIRKKDRDKFIHNMDLIEDYCSTYGDSFINSISTTTFGDNNVNESIEDDNSIGERSTCYDDNGLIFDIELDVSKSYDGNDDADETYDNKLKNSKQSSQKSEKKIKVSCHIDNSNIKKTN